MAGFHACYSTYDLFPALGFRLGSVCLTGAKNQTARATGVERTYTLNVPNLLKAYLKREKINQNELARRLKVNKANVSLWIRGRIIPSLRHYLSIERLTK
jgi:DNA-binding XRE family transcriptional regulator